jgi:hypothetical protein
MILQVVLCTALSLFLSRQIEMTILFTFKSEEVSNIGLFCIWEASSVPFMHVRFNS